MMFKGEPRPCSDEVTKKHWTNSTCHHFRWGKPLAEFMSIEVDNRAQPGWSSRFWLESKEPDWKNLVDTIEEGDIVLLEFGHNDMWPTQDVLREQAEKLDWRDRGTIPTANVHEERLMKNYMGQEVTVHSYGWYITEMIETIRSKRGVPVVSSMVPSNLWEDGKLVKDWEFADLAKQVASEQHVDFLDHTKYTLEKFRMLGEDESKKLYSHENFDDSEPGWEDWIHVNEAGAKVVAETLVQAIKEDDSSQNILKQYLNRNGQLVSTKRRSVLRRYRGGRQG